MDEYYQQEVQLIIKNQLNSNLKIWLRVDGNSMYPFLQNGDKVLVSKINSRKVRIGELCLFQAKGSLFTHRIIGFGKSKVLFKGDHNLVPDGWVFEKQIWGRIIRISKGNRVWELSAKKWQYINFIIGLLQIPTSIIFFLKRKNNINIEKINHLEKIFLKIINLNVNFLERLLILGK